MTFQWRLTSGSPKTNRPRKGKKWRPLKNRIYSYDTRVILESFRGAHSRDTWSMDLDSQGAKTLTFHWNIKNSTLYSYYDD